MRTIVLTFVLIILSPMQWAKAREVLLSPQEAIRLDAKRESALNGARPGSFRWIPRTHRLIYSKQSADLGSVIYVRDIDGGAPIVLQRGADPSPAPDGQSFVFIRKNTADSKTGIERVEIWKAKIDGSGASRIVTIGDAYPGTEVRPIWSPDSTRILYSYVVSGWRMPGSTAPEAKSVVEVYPAPGLGMPHLKQSMWVYDCLSNKTTLLLEHDGQLDADGWLDRDTVIYEHDTGSELRTMMSDVSSLSISTGQSNVIVSGLQRQAIYTAKVSPSGTDMAFLANADASLSAYYPVRTDLAVLHLPDKQIRYVLSGQVVSSGYVWSPDSRWILYTTGSSTHRRLYAADSRGVSHPLTTEAESESSPVFSQDGKYLAWLSVGVHAEQSIRVGAWDNGSVKEIRPFQAMYAGVAGPNASAIEWQSRDGLTIDGYVVLPTNYHAGEKYPAIVVVHGGPDANTDLMANEWPGGPYFVELLAQRGYVVFVPDYRGSQRFGFDKLEATRQRDELLQPDFDDITTGIDFLQNKGIVDPQRVAVLGHSWGSVEVNWLITHTNRFAAAVSYEGGDTLLGWGSKYEINSALEWYMRGSPVDRLDVYLKNWAEAHVKGAKTPTLFVASTDGGDYGLQWLFAALRAQGTDTQYLYYRGESHVVQRTESKLDLLERLLDWLAKHGVR